MLAGCARVCKAFFDPATRVLWARPPSIFVLFELLEPSIMPLFFGGRVDKEKGEEFETWVRLILFPWLDARLCWC